MRRQDNVRFPFGGLLSDELSKRYGPISANVLGHDARERRARLVDLKGVTRIFTLTFLSRPMPGPLRRVNREIQSGRLIGEAFRDHGFTIRRNVLDVFVIALPAWLRKSFRVKEGHAWSRIFEFHARQGAAPPVIYGTVCEVFTPDFKPPLVRPEDVSGLGACAAELLARGISREATWRMIGQETLAPATRKRTFEARVATLELVFDLRERVAELLGSR